MAALWLAGCCAAAPMAMRASAGGTLCPLQRCVHSDHSLHTSSSSMKSADVCAAGTQHSCPHTAHNAHMPSTFHTHPSATCECSTSSTQSNNDCTLLRMHMQLPAGQGVQRCGTAAGAGADRG
ncbi:hypothetical protein COO60DRAFT_576114 [Scenedesmus sp. NREL 46B-D3]|nr:hypothetical protein COO60DRAFT_576114 [Scenedesmus sp. NREL 46B-D3]